MCGLLVTARLYIDDFGFVIAWPGILVCNGDGIDGGSVGVWRAVGSWRVHEVGGCRGSGMWR